MSSLCIVYTLATDGIFVCRWHGATAKNPGRTFFQSLLAQPVHPRVVCYDPYPGVDGIVVIESFTDIHQVQNENVVVIPEPIYVIGG